MFHAGYIDLVQSHKMLPYSIQFDGDITVLCGMEIRYKHATHCVCVLFESKQYKHAGYVEFCCGIWQKLMYKASIPDNTFFTEIT
jgi:hypothetical protein